MFKQRIDLVDTPVPLEVIRSKHSRVCIKAELPLDMWVRSQTSPGSFADESWFVRRRDLTREGPIAVTIPAKTYGFKLGCEHACACTDTFQAHDNRVVGLVVDPASKLVRRPLYLWPH
jgi:hypothetical protein